MTAVLTLMVLVSVAGLWFWLAWLYRDYRVDLFRERLFAVRDDLFDVARIGVIPFDNPAYGMLRTQINGFIRFGDRVSVPWLVALAFAVRGTDETTDTVLREMDERWTQGLNAIEKPERDKLIALRERVHAQFATQVVFASPLILAVSFMLVLPLVVMVVLAKQLRQWFSKWQSQADVAAYSEGCLA